MPNFSQIFKILPQANSFTCNASKLIWSHNMSANLLTLVEKIADYEMSSFECNTFENLQFRDHKRSFVWQVPASTNSCILMVSAPLSMGAVHLLAWGFMMPSPQEYAQGSTLPPRYKRSTKSSPQNNQSWGWRVGKVLPTKPKTQQGPPEAMPTAKLWLTNF